MRTLSKNSLLCALWFLGWTVARAYNAVDVTVDVAQPTLVVGQSTTVTVYGQIAGDIASSSEQIFSWYIDLLCDNSAVAAGYGNVQTPASDNGALSSDGTPDGPNLRAVYDLFTGNPGAGKGSPVILVQFEVNALSAGVATFSAAPGTMGIFSNDFVVDKTGGGSFTGGNYLAASSVITVLDPPDPYALGLRVTGDGNEATVTFSPIAGFAHIVQRNSGTNPGDWSDLPGAPHNSGMVVDDITGTVAGYYRVVIAVP